MQRDDLIEAMERTIQYWRACVDDKASSDREALLKYYTEDFHSIINGTVVTKTVEGVQKIIEALKAAPEKPSFEYNREDFLVDVEKRTCVTPLLFKFGAPGKEADCYVDIGLWTISEDGRVKKLERVWNKYGQPFGEGLALHLQGKI